MSENKKQFTSPYQELFKGVLDCALYAYNNFTCIDKSKAESQFRKDLNFCILGGPGCGKSAYTKYYCKRKGIECEVTIVSQISAADASGIEIPKNKLNSNQIEVPFNKLPNDKKESIIKHFENGDFKLDNITELEDGKIIFNLSNDDEPELIFCPPAWMKKVHDKAIEEQKKSKPFILHLDEINTADRFIMKIFLGVILDKKMRDYEWPDNVIIIASGNYDFDVNDPAFMTRFIVCASDKSPLVELPICNMQDYEISRMVNNAMKIAFNTGSDEPKPLLDDNFIGITIPDSQWTKLHKTLLDIFEKARLDANSSNSSDLNITYDKGVSGILLNFRNCELILSAIVAAIKTNNWKPVLIRCLCDNIGTFYSIDKVPYYSYLSKIKTLEVDPNGNISTMDLDQFENLYRDAITTNGMNPYKMEFIQSMLLDFSKVLNYYGSKDDSEVDNKLKDRILFTYKTSLGIVVYSGEVEDRFGMNQLYTSEVKQKFDLMSPLLEKVTGKSVKDLLS